VALLIPSIDLMGGKIVQLVQGEKKALEFDNLEYWIERFSAYPMVQVIDLDAARRVGDNRALVARIITRLKCQVGGGVHSIANAEEWVRQGAHRVIVGSSLLRDGMVDQEHARNLANTLGTEKLVFAVDSRGGKVAIAGWRENTKFTAVEMIQALEPYCGTFLHTHIDTEGGMQGIPMDTVQIIRQATSRGLIVAGGITSQSEIDTLAAMGIDAVVGMALYTGRIPG
jgi:phosphoribosylformimino-5-aminoimidazole carboxamide ribotide isomerase